MAACLARKQAPRFTASAVVNGEFQKVTLDQMIANGHYAVLVFIPAAWTFVCPTEIQAFSDNIEQFKKLGVNVATISTDTVHSHLAWINTPRSKGGLGKMNFPVIGDITKSISRDYGVLVEDPSDDMAGLALRGTFIIDSRGVVRNVTVNDAPVGRSVEETLRLIQAFQYTDTHGEVCPAGWKPGSKTMVADPVKSKEYFAGVADV